VASGTVWWLWLANLSGVGQADLSVLSGPDRAGCVFPSDTPTRASTFRTGWYLRVIEPGEVTASLWAHGLDPISSRRLIRASRGEHR
jgi:MOSC domain-containing protein YiiM